VLKWRRISIDFTLCGSLPLKSKVAARLILTGIQTLVERFSPLRPHRRQLGHLDGNGVVGHYSCEAACVDLPIRRV